jgi:hypothetical protein
MATHRPDELRRAAGLIAAAARELGVAGVTVGPPRLQAAA